MKRNTTDERVITKERLESYRKYLLESEKASNTVEKYIRDVEKLRKYANGRKITKELLLDYREYLLHQSYEPSSINTFLVAANGFLTFMEWYGTCVKCLRIQKEVFADEKRELSQEEFNRLVETAKKKDNKRLACILITFGSTGIRVGELRYVTVEAVRAGRMTVRNKGKNRTVILPDDLCAQLRLYIAENHIEKGVVFRTSKGNPVNRSNLWREMQSLCRDAHVDTAKVFPHNCRHLFARVYFTINKDIVKLANLLGHTSIETTKIYLRTSVREYMGEINRMGIVVDVMGCCTA